MKDNWQQKPEHLFQMFLSHLGKDPNLWPSDLPTQKGINDKNIIDKKRIKALIGSMKQSIKKQAKHSILNYNGSSTFETPFLSKVL